MTGGWLFSVGMMMCVNLLTALPAAAQADAYTIPAHPDQRIGRSFFGMHLHSLVPQPRALQNGERPTAWPDAVVGRLRLWDSDVRWADLEPEPTGWQFARMDQYVRAAHERGVPVVYALGSPPQWASARPSEPCPYGRGCAAEPRDMADWDRYVRTVARRYRGRIAAYEVWNEPHPSVQPPGRPGFYSGNWDMLMMLARRARAVLQEEDPQAQLWTPGFDGNPDILDDYLRRGGHALADAVSFHFYGATDAHIVPLATQLRAIMARHGMAGKPLIDSESSHGAPELNGGAAVDPTLAMAYTLRSLVLAAWAGVTASYHHAWDNQHSGMVGRRGEQRPLNEAYRRLQSWLIGTEPLGCRADPQGGARPLWVTCRGRQGGRTLQIVWRADAPEPAPYPLPLQPAISVIEPALPGIALPPTTTITRTVLIGAMPLALWSTP